MKSPDRSGGFFDHIRQLGEGFPGEIFDGSHKWQSKTFLKIAYLMETGNYLADDQIKKTASGKPFVPGGPKFSISHSGDIWAVTFMDENDSEEVGIDIEIREHSKKLTKKVLKRILTPGEKPVNGDYLNNFVIKEAYGKLTGEGLGANFREVDANDLIKKYRSADLSNDKYIWWILQGSNL